MYGTGGDAVARDVIKDGFGRPFLLWCFKPPSRQAISRGLGQSPMSKSNSQSIKLQNCSYKIKLHAIIKKTTKETRQCNLSGMRGKTRQTKTSTG
jgi:hypothetical protein